MLTEKQITKKNKPLCLVCNKLLSRKDAKYCARCKPNNGFKKGNKLGNYIRINSTKVTRSCQTCLKKFIFYEKTNLSRPSSGKFCSRKCLSLWKKTLVGEKAVYWKGDKAGKSAIHKWIENKVGKPKKCDFCKTIKANKFEWANKDHKYSRNLNNWFRLCTSCHRKYDVKNNQYKNGNNRKTNS